MALIAFFIGGLKIGFCQATPVATGSAATYRVAGSVVSKADGHPLGSARVVLADIKDRQKARTTFSADDGKFEFTGVPAGKYSLVGARRGFLPAGYDQHDQFSTAIVTGAGLDTENLTLRLSPAALITGKLFDEAGEPVRHGQIRLYRVNHGGGLSQVQLFRVESVNDLGVYEITRLTPGTYYLSAQATPWYAVHPPKGSGAVPTQVDPALDVAYPVTYYADTADPDAAIPIVLRDGGRVEVDIHLSPVPALRLTLHLPDDAPNVYPQLRQIGPGGAFAGGFIPGTAVQRVSSGVWEVSGIPAGRYNILVAGSVEHTAAVDLMNDGQEVDASGSELSRVKISVQIAGQKSVPPDVVVFLRPDRGRGRAQPVDKAGETPQFEVVPGRYEVIIGSEKTYSIAHISASGCEASGQTVNLPAGTAAISLTLVETVTRVEGVVKQDVKPVAGAMVVLVPKDPAANRSLFRRDQSDLDGTFALNSVSAGTYTVVAIADGWDLDWSEPGVISAYLKRGQIVEVRNDEPRSITLSRPLEAQPR